MCDADVPDDALASPTEICEFVHFSGRDDAGPFAMFRGRFDGVEQEIVTRASVLVSNVSKLFAQQIGVSEKLEHGFRWSMTRPVIRRSPGVVLRREMFPRRDARRFQYVRRDGW